MQILSSSLLPVGQTDFTIAIADAMKSGARIFVFFMTAKDMGALLLQGYQTGLFHSGTQIIASDASTASAALWANMPPKLVTTIMRGVIGFAPNSDYKSIQGQSFLKALLNEKNTVQDPHTGLCNNQTDDTGHYLFQEALNPAFPNVYNCSGTNFSKYYADGSNVDNYSPYTYDATYAIARAMHILLYEQNQPKINGKALFTALINNVSFVGATGAVNFSHALTADSTRFGEGDRRTGISYRVMNFKPSVYNADPSGSSGYVVIGEWTIEAGNKISGHVTYNTMTNSPPSDLPPTIYLRMHGTFIIILTFLGVSLFFLLGVLTIVTVVHRKTRLLKTSQLKMQSIIIVGGFLGAARVITGTLPVNDINCSLNIWFGHLSFWLIFGPIMLKTWRVHKIVNNKTLKRVTVTENHILILFSGMISFIVVYLCFLQALPSFTPRLYTRLTLTGIQYYSDNQCRPNEAGKPFTICSSELDNIALGFIYHIPCTSLSILNPRLLALSILCLCLCSAGFEVTLMIIEAILLMITSALCYATKEVPGTLNDASNNLKCKLCQLVYPLNLIKQDFLHFASCFS